MSKSLSKKRVWGRAARFEYQKTKKRISRKKEK